MKKMWKLESQFCIFAKKIYLFFPFKDVATNGFLGKNFKKLLHKVKE